MVLLTLNFIFVWKMMLKEQGYVIDSFPLDPILKVWVRADQWQKIDDHFKELLSPTGELFLYLQKFLPFTQVETMLAVRDSQNEWEEDGIWHDDGSRQFAISLSLNEFPETIEGGKLGFRKKGEEKMTLIPTPKFGEMIVFLSGIHGYEHRTHQVTKGRRIILVGWFS